MKIGQESIVRSTGGPDRAYQEDFGMKATKLWKAIVKKHPDAKLIKVEDIDVGKYYWNLVEITYTYDHQ